MSGTQSDSRSYDVPVDGELLRMLLEGAPSPAYWQVLQQARESDVSRQDLANLEHQIGDALELRNQLEQHRQREEGLAALYETAVDLTALHDVEAVLRAIVRRARQLLQTDTAYMTLNDDARSETYMRVSVGTVSPRFEQLRVPFGGGLGGIVAATGRPYFTTYYRHDERLKHVPVIDAVVEEEGLVAILGVPMMRTGELVGVLFASDRRERVFRPEEINLLSSLAALAAVALHNAELIEHLQRVVSELHRANEYVREHNRSMESAAAAHGRLTSLMAHGGNITALAATVAEVLGGPAGVLDEYGVVVAQAGQDGGASEPEPSWSQQVVVTAVSSGTFEAAPGWWATPIVASGAPLGTLFVGPPATLDDVQQRTLERAAQVAAGLILNERAVEEAEQRVRGELLDELLSNETPHHAAVQRLAARVGVDLSHPFLVAGVAVSDADVSLATRIAGRKAKESGGLAGAHAGLIAVLLPGADIKLVSSFVSRIATLIGGTCTAATAGPVTDLKELRSAVISAMQTVQALISLGRLGVTADASDLGFFRLLLAGREPGDVAAFIDAALGSLIEYDRRRGTDLLATLEAYLGAQANVTKAAARLHVHPNTLYKRLDRLTALLGPGWEEPGRRLQLELALVLRRLADR